MIIVFDTETTGLPKDYSANAEDVDNWPRIIQLAYATFENNGTPIERVTQLIKPNGWRLMTKEEAYADGIARGKTPADAEKGSTFWIDNGYTDELLMEKGVPIEQALARLVELRLQAEVAVAHNISFDGKIVRAEMIRAGMQAEFTAKKVCTMMKTAKFCNLPNKNGKLGKWPTLDELHNVLFGSSFTGAHDAGNDVDACAKCFFELVRLNVLSLS
jgi:DNA polymerase III epsilon subunit-like protein